MRLLQLLGDLKTGKLSNLDPINETLINLEKRKLALEQHLTDLDMDYLQTLKNTGEDELEDSQNLQILNDKISAIKSRVTNINRFQSDLTTINRVISTEFQQDFIKISKSKIKELFKLENDEEYQLIFRKSELVDSKNEIYKFTKIDLHKNLKELGELLKKEKQNCDDLKNKIENDRLQWLSKQNKFIQVYTSLS